MEHYNSVRNRASEIHAYAPDARILTTYYCGMCYLSQIIFSIFETGLIQVFFHS